MSFGQSSGPAAGHALLKDLQALLARAGYDDFRTARGPYQLTQRQGGGKFTRDEAEALLDRLRDELGDEPVDHPGNDARAPSAPEPAPAAAAKPAKTGSAKTGPAKTGSATVPPEVRAADDDVLVAELRRRGFRVFPPAR